MDDEEVGDECRSPGEHSQLGFARGRPQLRDYLGGGVVGHAAVLDHDGLGLAGRPGGVYQVGQVVGADRRQAAVPVPVLVLVPVPVPVLVPATGGWEEEVEVRAGGGGAGDEQDG